MQKEEPRNRFQPPPHGRTAQRITLFMSDSRLTRYCRVNVFYVAQKKNTYGFQGHGEFLLINAINFASSYKKRGFCEIK